MFSFISALSLLLFVAVCVLWGRSYLVADVVSWRSGDPAGAQGWYDATSARGVICFQCQSHAFEGRLPPSGVRMEYQTAWNEGWFREDPAAVAGLTNTRWWNRRGFAFARERQQWPGAYGMASVQRRLFVAVPHWLLVLAAAVLPALWLIQARRGRWRRRRRWERDGLCRSCGYDLRATPGRCPECGVATLSPTSGGAAREWSGR
jgi:hypothetical protein